ncbi:MAG: cation:dicarboxylase symporter family transporter [Xanthomonadales bacterium]|nr:cation:dicarboxylase symporter family transporter [Xanthomonadales bacterium]
MRSLGAFLEEYGRTHRHPTNLAIHKLCVPLIALSTVGLLWSLPLGRWLGLAEPFAFWFNGATVALLPVLVFYARLGPRVLLAMAAFFGACLALGGRRAGRRLAAARALGGAVDRRLGGAVRRAPDRRGEARLPRRPGVPADRTGVRAGAVAAVAEGARAPGATVSPTPPPGADTAAATPGGGRASTRAILLALVAGLGFGLLLNGAGAAWPVLQELLARGLFDLLARWFVAALMMLVVPVVLVTLVNGIGRLADPARLGRIALQTLALYLGTTALAISLALAAALLVDPGEGRGLELPSYAAPAAPSVREVLVGLIPRNPVQAMAEGNMLQLIVFSVFLGLALALVRGRAPRVAELFEQLETVVLALVELVIRLAPIGVFALMARLGAELGLEAIAPLFAYFLTVLGVLLAAAVPRLSAPDPGLSPASIPGRSSPRCERPSSSPSPRRAAPRPSP